MKIAHLADSSSARFGKSQPKVGVRMNEKTQDLLVERRDQVGWITFNRPDRLNAFNYDSFGQLAYAVEDLAHDSSIGVIVLTGAGDKSFCAGGYLADLANFNRVDARKLYDLSQRCFQALRKAPQPIVAAVNGFAIGGGNELVICSDLAIASEHARFGQAGP